jgi:hypothetical protein
LCSILTLRNPPIFRSLTEEYYTRIIYQKLNRSVKRTIGFDAGRDEGAEIFRKIAAGDDESFENGKVSWSQSTERAGLIAFSLFWDVTCSESTGSEIDSVVAGRCLY